jgi:hypothetical protein
VRRALLLLALACGVGGTAQADRCHAHCRDKARTCKLRCKLNHPEGPSQSRHRCLERCELAEAQCRTEC